jgi:hypothetical protein
MQRFILTETIVNHLRPPHEVTNAQVSHRPFDKDTHTNTPTAMDKDKTLTLLKRRILQFVQDLEKVPYVVLSVSDKSPTFLIH